MDDAYDTPYRAAPSPPNQPPTRVQLDLERDESIERIFPIGEGVLVVTGDRTIFVSVTGVVHATPLSKHIAADASGTVFWHRDTIYVSPYTPGNPRALSTNVRYLQDLRVYGPFVYWIDILTSKLATSLAGHENGYVLYKARRAGGPSTELYSTDRRIENLEVGPDGVSWTVTYPTRSVYSRVPHGEIQRKHLLQNTLDTPKDKVRDLVLQPQSAWYDWLSSVVRPFQCWTATSSGGVAWINPSEGKLRWTVPETGQTQTLYSSRRVSVIAGDSRSVFAVDRRAIDDFRPTLFRVSPEEARLEPIVTFDAQGIAHKTPRGRPQSCLVLRDGLAYFAAKNELFWVPLPERRSSSLSDR